MSDINLGLETFLPVFADEVASQVAQKHAPERYASSEDAALHARYYLIADEAAQFACRELINRGAMDTQSFARAVERIVAEASDDETTVILETQEGV